MKQWFKDFVHNVIVHPLLMILPIKYGTNLHDRNANWAYGNNHYNEISLEKNKFIIHLTI